MSYENYFTLSIKGEATEEKTSMVCPECGESYEMGTKFCKEDGVKLEEKIADIPVEGIISKLREFGEEASMFLNDDGSSEESGSSHTIEQEILDFSKKYPNVIFQLDIQWETGLGSPPSRYYFKDGKKQDCKTTITFDEYDETKLK